MSIKGDDYRWLGDALDRGDLPRVHPPRRTSAAPSVGLLAFSPVENLTPTEKASLA